MADGTISIADGLGFKALDSNELRREGGLQFSDPLNSVKKPFDFSSIGDWSSQSQHKQDLKPFTEATTGFLRGRLDIGSRGACGPCS
ncbi:hypothetical protein RHMOL_Rhmol04G0165400 [Rhododendron molle]|uniref:Uncharacterized protein n=1 Tax=Rhododendron molle TaxID=49168 RepID=A0ACC0P2S3_RHOML|nr:hypothetical protein RHMOL_Rhmol04G0165400 [Rhododendron molle]